MIISVLLLGVLLPHVTQTAFVDEGIVNGTEVKPHSRPYMVSVQRNGEHFCGGLLVSEQCVMTAAHCFNKGWNLTVVIGAHDLRHSSVRIPVKFYHIYPGYNSESPLNDIMILQLSQTIKNRKNVNSISIANENEDIKAKSTCSIAGWGKQTSSGSHSDRLMEVKVTITDNKACQGFCKSSLTLCAIHPGGFCKGDSGGPLVCNGRAVGVAAWKQKNVCVKPTKPNIYTRISKYLPWINAILKAVDQKL